MFSGWDTNGELALPIVSVPEPSNVSKQLSKQPSTRKLPVQTSIYFPKVVSPVKRHENSITSASCVVGNGEPWSSSPQTIHHKLISYSPAMKHLSGNSNGVANAGIADETFGKLCSLCRHGQVAEVTKLLDDRNISIDMQDSRGNTLVHIACQNGNRRMVKLCVRRGYSLNTQNYRGQTPLHFCYAFGFEELAQLLLSHGADDTIRNHDNLTCYEGLGAGQLSEL